MAITVPPSCDELLDLRERLRRHLTLAPRELLRNRLRREAGTPAALVPPPRPPPPRLRPAAAASASALRPRAGRGIACRRRVHRRPGRHRRRQGPRR